MQLIFSCVPSGGTRLAVHETVRSHELATAGGASCLSVLPRALFVRRAGASCTDSLRLRDAPVMVIVTFRLVGPFLGSIGPTRAERDGST